MSSVYFGNPVESRTLATVCEGKEEGYFRSGDAKRNMTGPKWQNRPLRYAYLLVSNMNNKAFS
jgi:hypothetical protein